jgi:cell division transport system permease protein
MAYRAKSGEISYLRRRSRANYVTATLSIALVLFFLGTFATLALFTKAFTRSAKESIEMRVSLYDGIGTAQLQQFMEKLLAKPYVLDARYISKEEAARLYLEQTGEDLLKTLDGINPLPPEVRVKLRSTYLEADSIAEIESQLKEEIIVSDIAIPTWLLDVVNQNANTLAFAALLIGGIAILIAFYLIFGTIRLAIYAKRLTIRSMQLIGATKGFIRRPFLRRGLGQGFLAGVLASAMLTALLYLMDTQIDLLNLTDQEFFDSFLVGVLGSMIGFGCILGFWGSYMAVNRYLDQDLDELMQ